MAEQIKPGPSTSSAKLPEKFFESKTIVSKVKHDLLKSYIGGWFAILGNNQWRFGPNGYSKLVYVDGFAGKGVYDDGREGSPALVYELALTHNRLKEDCPDIYLIFVEKDPKNSTRLLQNLLGIKESHQDAQNAAKVKFMVIKGEFAKAMEWILHASFQFSMENWESVHSIPDQFRGNPNLFITKTTPLFVFADSWHYSGKVLPMEIMMKILTSSSKSEILLNLMTGSIRRFMKCKTTIKALSLLMALSEDDVLCKTIVLEKEDKTDRIKTLLGIYENKLKELTSAQLFTNWFWMRNDNNVLLYNLLSISQHPQAFLTMKKAMQKASESEKTFKFSAFNAQKPDFDIDKFTIEEVAEHLMTKFQGQVVTGKQLTDELNYDENFTWYQKYKWGLKSALENYCVSENKSKKQQFDNMLYQFPILEN